MKLRLIELLLFTGVLPSVLSLPRTYYLIQQPKSWLDAQTYCRDVYTDLAVINTNEEMTKVQSAVKTPLFTAWIGLSTNINSWHWSMNNEPLEFTSWDPAEPNNLFSDELCVFMLRLKWFDAPCYWFHYFVCFDVYPVQKKTIRLKFQSSENLNNPEIMMSIEEKLKEKLIEHGMEENIIVTWKKNPDGEVFYTEE